MKEFFKELNAKYGWQIWFVMLIYMLLFIGLAFGMPELMPSSPSEPSESVSEEVTNTQEVQEKKSVVEPVNAQEEVVLEEAEKVSGNTIEPATYEYFDVPLDQELQEYIFMVCELYNMEPAIIVAMIEKESTYRVDCVGDQGRSFGLMQIQQRWHEQRMLDLGVEDLLDPYQNVSVGIDYISELYDCDNGIGWALMAYNGGIAYANEREELSTYARWVLDRSHELGWRVW